MNMKLTINKNIRNAIISKIENDESVKTWEIYLVRRSDGRQVKRLMHTGGEHQYVGVGLRLSWNKEEEMLSIAPTKRDKSLSGDEYFEKCCVVLGRFAEFLNRYFSDYDYIKTN